METSRFCTYATSEFWPRVTFTFTYKTLGKRNFCSLALHWLCVLEWKAVSHDILRATNSSHRASLCICAPATICILLRLAPSTAMTVVLNLKDLSSLWPNWSTIHPLQRTKTKVLTSPDTTSLVTTDTASAPHKDRWNDTISHLSTPSSNFSPIWSSFKTSHIVLDTTIPSEKLYPKASHARTLLLQQMHPNSSWILFSFLPA